MHYAHISNLKSMGKTNLSVGVTFGHLAANETTLARLK